MKYRTQSVTFFTTLLLGVITFLLGCATTGMQRSEKATTTMQTVADEISQVAVQLDATGASLDDLTRAGQSDVGKAFDSFSANVTQMDNLEQQFAKHAEEMRSRGKEYFAEWKQQGTEYTNPEIRELSEQRRAALGEIYRGIAEASLGVNSAFKAYMSDLKEIQTYLSNDLTPKGVEAIIPSTDKVVRDGESLKNAVNRVQTAIDRARGEMAQGGTN
jgi:hypothetical protein